MTTKESQTKKSGDNYIMPIILFLVSAFVITATFYEDSFKNAFAWKKDETEINKNEVAASKIEVDTKNNVDVVSEAAVDKNNVTSSTQAQSFVTVTDADRNTIVTNSSEKSTPQESTSKETTTQEQTSLTAATIASGTEQATALPITDTKDTQTHSVKPAKLNNQHATQNYITNNYAERNRAPRNHTESNQSDHLVYGQKRQQYLSALQQRRQTYQNEMRKQQQKFNKSFAANKAIYLQNQKKRYEADQKIQQIQNQISRLNEEIRQLRLNTGSVIKDFPVTHPSMPTSKQM